MDRQQLPAPEEGFIVTHSLIVKDIPTSVDFYVRVLGGEIVFVGEVDSVQRPTMVKLANTWLIINIGGGPTEDKPTVSVAPPVLVVVVIRPSASFATAHLGHHISRLSGRVDSSGAPSSIPCLLQQRSAKKLR